MKKSIFAMVVALAAISASVFTSCKEQKKGGGDNPPAESVVINGVRWATRNIDAPGTFAANPEDAGMLYQWNSKIGWSSTDPMVASDGSTTWNKREGEWDNEDAWEWKKANDPSPAGYHIPTVGEISKLLDDDKVEKERIIDVNGVPIGIKFTDKSNGNSIFLPITNWRDEWNGELESGGKKGCYRSSTPQFGKGYFNFLPMIYDDDDIADAFSIRCVSDNKEAEATNPVKEQSAEITVINGVRWATRNVDAPGKFAKNPEDAGMFYKWNSKIGWKCDETGSVTSFFDDYFSLSDIKWEKANDPSPTGYRVPTLEEFFKLLDKDKVSTEQTTLNGVAGRKFTDKTTGAFIFLCDAGYIGRCDDCDGCSSGCHWYWSECGSYWSCALLNIFFNNYDGIGLRYYDNIGLSVRPVAK